MAGSDLYLDAAVEYSCAISIDDIVTLSRISRIIREESSDGTGGNREYDMNNPEDRYYNALPFQNFSMYGSKANLKPGKHYVTVRCKSFYTSANIWRNSTVTDNPQWVLGRPFKYIVILMVKIL